MAASTRNKVCLHVRDNQVLDAPVLKRPVWHVPPDDDRDLTRNDVNEEIRLTKTTVVYLPHLQLLLCNDKWVSLPLQLDHDRGAHCNLESPCAKDTSPFIPDKTSEDVYHWFLHSLGHVWRGDLLVRLFSSGPSLSCIYSVDTILCS